MTMYQVDMYLYVRINVWKNITKQRKKHPPQGDDASTVLAGTRRVERGELGEARPAISAPRGKPHLYLGGYGSKPGLNLTSWLLRRHGQHIYTYVCLPGTSVIFTRFYSSMGTSRIIGDGPRD